MLVLAYALSPIDLIPDFLPVVGYLDDILLLPLAAGLLLRGLPAQVREDCRRAASEPHERPAIWRSGAILVGLTWLLAIGLSGGGLYAWLR